MKKKAFRSREILATAAVIALSAGLTACGSSGGSASSDSKELTFVNYGGDGMKNSIATWLDPYTKKTGVKFKTDQPSDQAKIKAMVQSGKVSWNVVDIDASSAGPECGRLYEKRPADFDLSQIRKDEITDDCMIPIIGQDVALVYNKKLYGNNPPTSLTDFWNKDFPGQRIAFNYWTGTAEPMAMAAGVPADKVYPINWDLLNQKVSDFGTKLTFFSSLDQQSQSLESGNFGMCLCYLGRAAISASNGADVGIVWDKVWTGWDGLYVVKGTPNLKVAWDFVQYLATREGQNPYYSKLPYSPTTTGAPPEVPAKFKPYMAAFNEDKIKDVSKFDAKYWQQLGGEAADRWTKLTAG